MSKPTLDDLMARARSAIENKEAFIYDVASVTGQIVGNVAHMRWFRLSVAQEIADTTKKWAHLAEPIPQQ